MNNEVKSHRYAMQLEKIQYIDYELALKNCQKILESNHLQADSLKMIALYLLNGMLKRLVI